MKHANETSKKMTNHQIPKRNSAVDFSDLLEYDEFEAYDAFQMPHRSKDGESDNVPLSVELAQSSETNCSRKGDASSFVKAPELFLRIDGGRGNSQPESLTATPIREGGAELQYENEFEVYETTGANFECSTSFQTVENDNEQLLLEGMNLWRQRNYVFLPLSKL